MTPSFTISDLCALIRQAGESRVSELTLEGFSVKFLGPAIADNTPRFIYSHAQPQGVDSDQPESSSEDLLKAELKLRDEELAMALIENPAEYERLIAAGELDDDAAV